MKGDIPKIGMVVNLARHDRSPIGLGGVDIFAAMFTVSRSSKIRECP